MTGVSLFRVRDILRRAPKSRLVPSSEYQREGSLPIVDQGDGLVGGYTDRNEDRFPADSPVVVFGDHTCRLKYIDFPFARGAQGTQVLLPVEGVSPRFLYYALHTVDVSQFGYQRHFKYLKEARIPVPALQTQTRIATALGVFDDLIENNRRRIEILEEMARLIYREWFVNYRFPGHQDVALVDSDLGPIPYGWETKAVGDVADLVRGRSYRATDLVEPRKGRPFLNLKCIDRGGGFRKSGLKRYDGAFKEEQLALPGDTVLAVTDMTQERNIVAQAARVPLLPEGSGVISLDLVRVLPSDAVDGDYLYAMFRYSSFSSEVKEHANGTNVLHLSPDRIREFPFVVPPVELQKSFREAVRPTYRLVDSLELQSETLAQARCLLLPRLISGELDVSDLDLDLEPVA